eukprot:jgi/Mesen1/471/ME000101S10702
MGVSGVRSKTCGNEPGGALRDARGAAGGVQQRRAVEEGCAKNLEMEEAGLEPECSEYCLLLSEGTHRGRWRGVWRNMAFYNALLEALWLCGLHKRAAAVLQRIPEAVSSGAALTLLRQWLAELGERVELDKVPLPICSTILHAAQPRSRGQEVVEDEEMQSPVRSAVQAAMLALQAPFRGAAWSSNRIVCSGPALRDWHLKDSTGGCWRTIRCSSGQERGYQERAGSSGSGSKRSGSRNKKLA